MRIDELIERLINMQDGNSELEEVFFKDSDGYLHEIDLSEYEAAFDGFDEVTPAGISITAAD